MNVHLGKQSLAPADLLIKGIIVLNQAQHMVATLASPHLVASNQVGHASGADGRTATVTGEGVNVSSREQRSLRSYNMRGKMSELLGGTPLFTALSESTAAKGPGSAPPAMCYPMLGKDSSQSNQCLVNTYSVVDPRLPRCAILSPTCQ